MRLLLRGCTCEEDKKDKEFECKCLKIGGHLEAVKWMLWPRKYTPSPGFMGLRDWRQDMYIWLHYVESNDGRLADDDVLRHTPSRYWSIHDVQRYFLGDVHCEKGLFTYQYPNLRMPTRLGSYFWKSNIATKGHNTEYRKELHRSIMMSLLKTECSQRQMSKFILSDQLFNINKFDRHNRSSFLRMARNIFSCQDNLQLVSLENLCCKRLEGVELLQYLASFNADTLKYLFLWRFVSSYENPILINYSYITDDEKTKVAKLLEDLEVQEVRLPERCSDLVKVFYEKFHEEVEVEEREMQIEEIYENPYIVDKTLLEENTKKLKNLLTETNRAKKETTNSVIPTTPDPKRPWRTNSNKEKLLRLDIELKYHHDKGSMVVAPLPDDTMKNLIKECQEEGRSAPSVSTETLRNTVDLARKNLPNFQYKKIDNSTATAILPQAHEKIPAPGTPSAKSNTETTN